MEKIKLPRKRSSVWIHYNQCHQGAARCNICGVIVSIKGGSTSNLQRHLRNKHSKTSKYAKKLKKISSIQYVPVETVYENKNTDEDQDNDGRVILLENYPEEGVPEEVIIHDYDVETVELQVNENDHDSFETTAATKSIISENKITSQKKSNLEKTFTINKKSPMDSPSQEESMDQIVLSLDRMASSFEKIADYFCWKMKYKASVKDKMLDS